MTIQEALEARQGLAELGEYRMDTLAAVRVARLTRSLQAALKPFNEVHDDLVRRLSGGKEHIAPGDDDAMREYHEERAKMLSDDLGVEIVPITLLATGLREVKPNVLVKLADLVEITEK